jgi:hypothetical protein
MECSLAVIAFALIGFGVVSRRVEGTPFTPAMIFVDVGLLIGAQALDLLHTSPSGEWVKLLVEATLTVVLFADASRIDLPTRRAMATQVVASTDASLRAPDVQSR